MDIAIHKPTGQRIDAEVAQSNHFHKVPGFDNAHDFECPVCQAPLVCRNFYLSPHQKAAQKPSFSARYSGIGNHSADCAQRLHRHEAAADPHAQREIGHELRLYLLTPSSSTHAGTRASRNHRHDHDVAGNIGATSQTARRSLLPWLNKPNTDLDRLRNNPHAKVICPDREFSASTFFCPASTFTFRQGPGVIYGTFTVSDATQATDGSGKIRLRYFPSHRDKPSIWAEYSVGPDEELSEDFQALREKIKHRKRFDVAIFWQWCRRGRNQILWLNGLSFAPALKEIEQKKWPPS